MTRRAKRLWILAAIVAALIGGGVVAARAYLPSWLRTKVERAVSEATGRELKIAGTFSLSLSTTPTLVAEDVTLANAPWGSDPAMLRVGHAKVSVHLASLWNPPLRIKDLEIDGVRVLLEADADGRGNWVFEKKPQPASPPAETAGRPPVTLERVETRDFELNYRARRDAPPVRFGIARFDARLEPATGMIDLDAAGHFNETKWDLAGRVGTIGRLFEVRDVEHVITAHFGDAKISVHGRTREPLVLGGPDFQLEVEGPDIAASLATVGLRSPLSGPFHLRGRVSPSTEGTDLDLTAWVAGVTAAAQGHVHSLLDPSALDARVQASGPDASVVGEWIKVGGLPPRPFDVAGHISRADPWLSLDDVKGRVGGTSLAVSGAIGAPPRCVATDLAVTASGSELSELSRLTRLRLPTGAFTVSGRFLRRADALAVDDVDIRVRDTVVRGSGAIGEPPRLANLDLTVEANGPDLSLFSGIATIELPHEPFAVRGRVARRGAAIDLDGVEGQLGENTVAVRGGVAPEPRLVGTDLHARVAGPDLGAASALAGLRGLPAESYDISGQIRVVSGGYHFDGIAARVGRSSARIAGHVGARPTEDDTALDFEARGPALSDLAAWGVPAGLPAEPFAVSGRLRIDSRVYSVERVVATVGADRALLDGTLGLLPGMSRLDASVELSGPRLADIGRFFSAASSDFSRRLPAEHYTASGRVRRVPAGFESDDARVTVGDAEVRLAGLLGSGERLTGTDLRVDARAPDASLVSALTGVKLPAGPLQATGRIARVESGTRLDGVVASIGEVRAETSGLLGDPPKTVGTDLDVRVAGPDLSAALGPISGISPLPSDSFEVSAHLEGAVGQLKSKRFTARLGESDLAGSISVRFENKPSIEADLRSRHLDIPGLLGGFSPGPADAPAPPEPEKSPDKGDHLIPDHPLTLEVLQSIDAQVRLAADELVTSVLLLNDVAVEGNLRDGALRLSRFEGTGARGGRATANFSVEPVEGGYRLQAAGGIVAGRLEFPESPIAPEAAPFVDLEFSIDGAGPSLHAIAASSNGRALFTLGAGRVPTNMGAIMSSGFFSALLDVLNPFRKSSPYTDVECGVAAAAFVNGRTRVEPIAARTDKLTMIGRGKIDFDTEEIDLVWTIKPRKGVGISPGSIANPYIKLGGTLSSPSLEAKPLTAAASTGAAVATAGATLLFRGLYDRITAEKKVCIKALEEARRQVK